MASVEGFNKEDVEKARKLLKEYEQAVKEQEEFESWAMYEKAGCYKCHKGQIYSGGRTELDVTYYRRCECSYKPTKKYSNFLSNKDNMLVKDYEEMLCMFYDNNSHIKIGSNETDRSW